jgi:hypothetical protein
VKAAIEKEKKVNCPCPLVVHGQLTRCCILRRCRDSG